MLRMSIVASDGGGESYGFDTMLMVRARNPKIVYRKESAYVLIYEVRMRGPKWAESLIWLSKNKKNDPFDATLNPTLKKLYARKEKVK